MQITLEHVWKLVVTFQTSGIAISTCSVTDVEGVAAENEGSCTLTSPEAVQEISLPGDQISPDAALQQA